LAYDDAPPVFSQSGKQLLVSEHGVVTVRDVDALAVVKRIGRGRKPVYDASGTHILALDADGAIIYDASGAIVAALPDTGAMTAIFVGDRVATGGQDNNVKLWDLTGHELGVYAGFDHPVVAIASRDDFLAALDSQASSSLGS
jgi:WD40 repeat protein